MKLPITPPLEPMLAKLEPEVPRGEGWRYEPKWDGFRAVVFRDGDEVHIGSRGRRPLDRYFPEVVAAVKEALPRRAVVDGEIVVAVDRLLDFENL
ncbi:MAG TPA: ATP-dependent DNA ligase, partial [Actinomycetota bacterium]|nr:ATP-dependent DNA ligase [Actinomycetota bacterium]